MNKIGRPSTMFEKSSIRTKNRRVNELIENYSFEEFQYAADKLKNLGSKAENKKKNLDV